MEPRRIRLCKTRASVGALVMNKCKSIAAAFFVISVFAMPGLGPNGALAAGGGHVDIHRHHWTFGGFFGRFDRAQLRRGFQVYKEVCSNCHGLGRLYFRNLTEAGGPEFPRDGVEALAKEWDNQPLAGPNKDGEIVDEDGELLVRAVKLSDPILGPYRNAEAARSAHNGAVPPDLSLITKARSVPTHAPWYQHIFIMLGDILSGYQEGGSDYVYALLTGYADAPAGTSVAEGMHYNKAFAGHQIAMAPPLSEGGSVEYQAGAGAESSLKQNAEDVTAFLSWAADPSLEARKTLGWQVMLYLLITTVLLYVGKRRIWARVKH